MLFRSGRRRSRPSLPMILDATWIMARARTRPQAQWDGAAGQVGDETLDLEGDADQQILVVEPQHPRFARFA